MPLHLDLSAGLTTGTPTYRMGGLRSFSRVQAQSHFMPARRRFADIAACRSAYNTNPIFRRIIRAEVENVVGCGFRVLPATSDRGWNRAVKAYLEDRGSDLSFAFPALPGRSEWCMQLLATFHQTREGGAFLYRSARGMQLFEEGQCRTPQERLNDPLCRDGFQFASDGSLVGLWIGPYSEIDGYLTENQMTMIPWCQDDPRFGRLRVTSYLHTTDFGSGVRSHPPLACVIDDLERFADYYDNVSERAAAEASIVGVHKTNRPNPSKTFNVQSKNSTATDTDIDDYYKTPAYIEGGAVIPVGLDEDFKIEGLHTPGNTFDPYVKQTTRIIGAPASMPIEIVLLHFSDTNFSASKAAIEQFRIACRMQKRRQIEQYTIPNYRMAIYEGVRDGAIPYREDWRRVVVVPSGWRSLEEAREADAAVKRIQCGLTTVSFEQAMMFDRTPEDALDEIIGELDSIRERSGVSGYPEDLLRELYYGTYGGLAKKTSKPDPSDRDTE